MEYQSPRKLESAPPGSMTSDSFEVAEGLHLQFFSNKFIKTPLPAVAAPPTDPALLLARKQSRRERMRTLTSSLDGIDLQQIREATASAATTGTEKDVPASAPPVSDTNANNAIPPASNAQPAPLLSPSSKQKAKVSFNNEELEKVRTIPPRERRPSLTNRKPSLSARKSVNRKASQSVDLTLFNELSSILKSANEETAAADKEERSATAATAAAAAAAATTPRTLFQVGEENAESKRSSVDAKVTEFLKSAHRRTYSLTPAAATNATPTPPPAPTAADLFRMELIRAKSEVQATLKPAAAASPAAQDAIPSSPKPVSALTSEFVEATTELEITFSTQVISPHPTAAEIRPVASNDSVAPLHFLQPIKPSHSSSTSSVSSAGSSTLSMSPIGEGGSSDDSMVSTPTPIPTHDDTATPEASDITSVLPSFQALNIHSSLFEHRSKVHSALHRRSQLGEGEETPAPPAAPVPAQASSPIPPPTSALAAAIAASRLSPAPVSALPPFPHPPPRHASATAVPSRPSPAHQRNNSRSMSTDSVFAAGSAPSAAVAAIAVEVTSGKTPASPALSASSTSPSMVPSSPLSHGAKVHSPIAGHRAHIVTSPTNYRHSHSASLPTSPLFPQPSPPSAVPPVPVRDRTSPSMNGASVFHSPRTAAAMASSPYFSATSPNNKHMKSFSLGAAPTPASPQHAPSTGTSLLPAISNLLSAASPAPSGATSARAAAVNRMSSVGGRSESRRAVSDLTAALYILNRKR